MPTNPEFSLSRRTALRHLALAGGGLLIGGAGSAASPTAVTLKPARRNTSARREIFERVSKAALIDTHEHLIEEKERLQGAGSRRVPCDDWALLLSHYLDSDLVVAGMPWSDIEQFLSPKVEPVAKWRLLAPHWLAVRNTSYAQAVRLAIVNPGCQAGRSDYDPPVSNEQYEQ